MSLPIIAIPCYEDGNPYSGLPTFVKDMLKPYFKVLTESDVNKDPVLYGKIEGLLSHPGWSFTTPKVLDKMNNLKVVSTVSAGYNHLDLKYLKEKGIRVGYTPKVVAVSVAELSLGLILATARKMKRGFGVAMGKENLKAFTNTSNVFGHDISGKTIGIVGMGGIGFEVAKRCRAFDMNVLYHNRNKRDDDHVVKAQFYSTLHDMLPHCDYVLITCPLNEETRHLISDKEFQLMKSSSTIINVSRGPTIDHAALTKALQNRTIGAAGLDVTDPEPLPRDHPLLQLDNVTILPHIGTQTVETRTVMWQLGVDNLKAVIIDKGPMPSELVCNL